MRIIALSLLLLLLNCPGSVAQKNKRYAHFTGALSAGPNWYYNNMRIFRDHVRPLNYSAYGSIMWNSGYRVSLGIETGYNQFYRVGGVRNDSIKASLAAIPIQLVIGMRLSESFYVHFSFGPSLLLNRASILTVDHSMLNTVFSFADGSFALGYRKRLNNRFKLGLALKFNFSTKATDMNLALPVLLSYEF
jgi:hypothetical protein